MQNEVKLTRANNTGRRDERRHHHIWSFARRLPRARVRARPAYLVPDRASLAGAGKSLLISRVGRPRVAVPFANLAPTGIVNSCKSLLIRCPRSESRWEPSLPSEHLSLRTDPGGRADCGTHDPPR